MLTSGIHVVRGLQGGRCGMDVSRDCIIVGVSLWSVCIGWCAYKAKRVGR